MALYPQFINPRPPLLADVRFRRALSHGMDRQQLVDSFMGGLTSVAHVVITPSDREYQFIENRIARYDYDPRRTAQLVTELGYARGPDGMYRDVANQQISVELRTAVGDQLQENMDLSIADEWQRLGIGAEPVLYGRQQRDDQEWRQTRPAFEMVRQPSEIQRFHSSGTPLPENDFRGHNRTRYQSPELDALIDGYFVTIPWQERMQVLGNVVHHLTDQLVAIGTLYAADPMLISNRLVNASPAGQTANAHTWDLR
ncbi:MAG: hypothetical protein GEU73_16110 [Chloroflexi bacterium]|nr:hypothetical protein [Chloroflexota bacterium]